MKVEVAVLVSSPTSPYGLCGRKATSDDEEGDIAAVMWMSRCSYLTTTETSHVYKYNYVCVCRHFNGLWSSEEKQTQHEKDTKTQQCFPPQHFGVSETINVIIVRHSS